MRIKLFLSVLAALAIVAVGIAYVTGMFRDKPGGVAQIGGPFVLASTKGGEVNSAALRGKPYALFFGFTHCPEVCPTTLYDMSNALAKLGDDAKDFRVFFITVDPERDTLAEMKDYVANFDPRIEALVPSPEQLQTITRDFRVYFAKVPTSDGSYTMDHTATIFLMNAEGQFAGTIAFGEAPDLREAKLRRLLKGSQASEEPASHTLGGAGGDGDVALPPFEEACRRRGVDARRSRQLADDSRPGNAVLIRYGTYHQQSAFVE